uniref:Aminotransferase class V domain-containing protein n=1 Tax=Schizophyllum commune (strain H4-8 / FGSC 9210) TaxID=578458 RepID=D8Q269_SCHCM
MFPELQTFVPDAEIHTLTQKQPPKFGHALKEYFALDPDYVNLNHGSYGSCPSSVMEFAFDLGRKIERNPDYFDRVAVKPMLAKIREQLADFIGVKSSEVVIVHNASHGVNTVLWNIEWAPEDTIVITSTTYYAVDAAVKFIHDKAPHPSISHFPLLHPTTKEDILRAWEAHMQALANSKRASSDSDPNAKSTTPGKIVAIIDTISSNPGILNPWVNMVKIAKRYGALAVVDGAHSLGQEVDLKDKLREADPDFFVSNAHKWLYAKRGAAVFYVPERNQGIVKASFPVSPYYVSPKDRQSPSDNFVVQHNMTATIDWSNFFTIPAALQFRAWLGGEAAINAYTHKLALEGGKRIAEILQTEMMYPDEDSGMELSMVNVALPLPACGKVIEYAFQMKVQGLIQRKLLEERNLGPTRYYHNGRLWLRVSGQVWLEMEDFEKVGWGVKEVCEEVIEELQLEKLVPVKNQ